MVEAATRRLPRDSSGKQHQQRVNPDVCKLLQRARALQADGLSRAYRLREAVLRASVA